MVGERPVRELVADIGNVITERLPVDLANIFGLHVKTRIVQTRYGSVTVFFGVLLSGFTLIANYKGFYDSIQLIRKHCELLLEGLIRSKYDGELHSNVNVDHPKLDDPREMRFPRRLRHWLDHYPPEIAEAMWEFGSFGSANRGRRDAFFWFLLVLNIILLVALGIIVYGAVVKTYFPGSG